VASDGGHEIDPEDALLRSYGAEDEGGGAVSVASPIDPGRRVALAVGSAVHAALEVFDPQADPVAEIARCRREIEGALPLLLGPADRAAAQARAEDLLARFAGGPLLERLREIGPEIMARELPILLPPRAAGRVGPPGADMPAPVGFVSGAIDLLYRDPASGAVVVADFKTDRVERTEEIRAQAHAYAGQGGIYLRGIREALDLKDDFRFELWFLYAGRIEVVPV
jgi:ATP-dependent exoDNAse (exonuclease V) beta subunit